MLYGRGEPQATLLHASKQPLRVTTWPREHALDALGSTQGSNYKDVQKRGLRGQCRETLDVGCERGLSVA
jgi:hypothetical protein